MSLGEKCGSYVVAHESPAREALNRLQRDRCDEWIRRMKALDFADSEKCGSYVSSSRELTGKRIQARTVKAAHQFILRVVGTYGYHGRRIIAGTRTMAAELGLKQDTVRKYLAIAQACEWIDVVQEGRSAPRPEDRRPTQHQIREWWSARPRRVVSCSALPAVDYGSDGVVLQSAGNPPF